MTLQCEQADAGGLRLLSGRLEPPLKIGNVTRRRFPISHYFVRRRRACQLAVSALLHLAAFKGGSHVRITAQVNTYPVNALLDRARHDQRVATVDDPLRDLNGVKVRNLESSITAVAANTKEHKRPANSGDNKAHREQHSIPRKLRMFISGLNLIGSVLPCKGIPGVVPDFLHSEGTGGGTTAQERSKITFPAKEASQ